MTDRQTDGIGVAYTRYSIYAVARKKLSIWIKVHVVKPLWSLLGQFPNCRPNPSAVVVSYCCKLCSQLHTADADATQLDSCVA